MSEQLSGKSATTRHDRRRVRTRSALIGAGQRLFAARSIDGVSIDDITMAADVAKGSFYNHFDDKEKLADAIVELVQGDCEQEVYAANIGQVDPATRVARAVGALVRYARAHPERYRAMVNLTHRRADIAAPINRGVRHDIAEGLAAGIFHGITVEGGILAVFSLISSAIDHLRSGGAELRAVIEEMAFVLLRGLGVPDAAARAAATASAGEFGRTDQSNAPSPS